MNDLEKAQRHLSEGLKVLQSMYLETAADEPQGGDSGEVEAHLEMLTSLKDHESDLRTRLVEVRRTPLTAHTHT